MVLMRSILEVLRSCATHHPAWASAYPPEWNTTDWDRFVSLATHHRVVPLLAHHVQTGRLPAFPPPVMAPFTKQLHRTRLRHAALAQALDEIQSALTDAGIPFATLKGPPLADEAYATTGLRHYDDLDVMVNADDVRAAEAVLRDQGYEVPPHHLPAWLVRCYHFHTQWVHRDTGHCVELHWRPADPRMLPRRSGVTNYVAELRERPAAMAVYLAVHLAKHTLAYERYASYGLDPLVAWHPWSGLRAGWLLDFHGLCAARRLSPETLYAEADRWNARNALAFLDYLATPGVVSARQSAPAVGRYSLRRAFLHRLERELDQGRLPAPPPWWLRANTRTGFRPARFLDWSKG